MDQVKKLFASLAPRQRLAILAAVLMAAAGIWAITNSRRERDFRPLYTSMAPEDAGAVVQKLKESAVPYRLSDNGASVLVPSAKVAEARLDLAAAGLPKSGRIGFELFDKSSFGATEFVEHINYRRALEGELERSVMALAGVEQARVHITFPKESVFLDAAQPAKASVLLRLRAGTRILPQNVTAISHLVASAVEGLTPDAVSVLDMRGNLLGRPRKPTSDGAEAPDENREVERGIERDLVAKINATLEPLLGMNRFRTAASVECDWTTGEQSEESYDPTKEAILTSQKSEDTSGSPSVSGMPGTASNLPRPTSRPAIATSGLARRTENITYQPSRFVKRTRMAQGNIKRMSISVLLDQDLRWERQGRQQRAVLIPPTPEKLKAIRDVIAGATGLNPGRGDQLIVESLPFDSTLHAERPETSAPAPAGPQGSLWSRDPRMLVLAGIAAVMMLALLGAVLFLVTRKRVAKHTNAGTQAALAAGTAGPENALGGSEAASESGVLAAAKLVEQLAQKKDQPQLQGAGPGNGMSFASGPAEVLRQQVVETVKKEPTVAAKVLRTWLEE